jgi:hypothetical protein
MTGMPSKEIHGVESELSAGYALRFSGEPRGRVAAAR